MSRLRADDLPNCIEDLKNGEVDFLICYQSEYAPAVDRFPSLESLEIGRDKLVPVCKSKVDGTPLFNMDDSSKVSIPYLRFGSTAPISRHIEPLLIERQIHGRLSTVYENSMAGALRIRARDGTGVAWMPKSVVQPDLDAGLLALAGGPRWTIELEIRLHRITTHINPQTRRIWTFLALREGVPLAPAAP